MTDGLETSANWAGPVAGQQCEYHEATIAKLRAALVEASVRTHNAEQLDQLREQALDKAVEELAEAEARIADALARCERVERLAGSGTWIEVYEIREALTGDTSGGSDE